MRLSRPVLLAVAGAVALSACSGGGSPIADGVGVGTPADVAATVGDTEISRERVVEVAEGQSELLEETPEDQRAEAQLALERDILSAEIQLRAVEAAVEERFGLDVDDEAVDEALQASIDAQGGDEAFDDLAADQGLSPEEARDVAREGAYITALVEYVQDALVDEGVVDEEELRTTYDENVEQFQTSTARHILVETEEEAQDVLARLEAGEEFGALAEELSTDPGSGANGGELGEAPRGTYVPEFSDAIWAEDTELGEVVGPVETQFGFHLIIVDGRTTLSFEEARPQLEEQLTGRAFGDFLETVFDGLEVDVDPYYGEWDPEQRLVVPATEDEPATDAGDEPADTEGDEGVDTEGDEG